MVQRAKISYKIALIEWQAALSQERSQTLEHSHYVFSFVASHRLEFGFESAISAVVKQDAS